MNLQNVLSNAFAMSLYKKLRKEQNDKHDSTLRFVVDLREEIEVIEGPKGKGGIDGPQGLKGDKGDNGKAGINGKDGLNGYKGEKGDRGESGGEGDVGKAGRVGDKGEAGTDGKQGDKGDRGETGEQGIPGKKGRAGLVGLKGKDGLNGKHGLNGKDGLNGKHGLNGKDGKAGFNGKDGLKGDTPDINHLEEKLNKKLELIDVSIERDIDSLRQSLHDQAEAYRKEDNSELDMFRKKIDNEFNKFKKVINTKMIELASRPSSNGNVSGGGSYSIMDNRDVVMKKRSQIEGESILVFNPTIKKFESESFLSVLDRLKSELEVQYNKLIDVDGVYTYIGEALPGSTTSNPVWRIKRVEELSGVNKNDINIVWSNGSADLDKVWDDRLTYNYI